MKKLTKLLTLSILLFASANLVFAAEEYTSRRDLMQDEALRTDFNIQGEYVGKAGDSKLGLQLISDGNGKFRFTGYPDGLPGDGWDRSKFRMIGTAEYKDGKLTWKATAVKKPDGSETDVPDEHKDEVTVQVNIQRPQGQPGQGQRQPGAGGFRGLPVKLEFPANDKIGMHATVFEKVFRESPTLGAKAPAGAYVVFDGTNLDKFEPGAKMNETQRRNETVKTLWADATAKPFERKPYTLHLEFLLSYMPEDQGQARSNSGVYIDEAYECQVLDSFGLEGENNECGGFYQVAKPKVNMCFPPLTWQTYDIDFTPATFDADGNKLENARVTLKHNGVVIHDNIEFEKETPGCKGEA
ncbi:MAG: 3-keto-disaccharide hydrolase, partial [Thermoguttaceae bacterium]